MSRARVPVTLEEHKMALSCLRGRIVLIDDYPEILSALVPLFEMEGYYCESYLSAESYLDYDAERPLPFPGPWCVLSDVKLPGIDGLELQRVLIEKGNPPLILMSGNSGALEAVEGLRKGAIDFLIKPFDADDLLSVISDAMIKSCQTQQEAREVSNANERYALLTTREAEIIDRVLLGKINREIAEELDIALRTVKLHRQHAFEKLGVVKVVELVKVISLVKKD